MTRDNESRFDLSRRSYIKGLGAAGLLGATGPAATGTAGAVPAESIVSVGEGSYITERPADSQKPPSDPHLFTTDNVDAPLPSNDWWSGIHYGWNPYSSSEVPYSNGSTIAYPYYAMPEASGLRVHSPKTWTGTRSAGSPGAEEYGEPVESANFVGADYASIPRLVIGATAWDQASDTRTDGYGDWHVRARWGDDTSTPMDVTMTRGSPFIFCEYQGSGAELTLLDESDEALDSANLTVFAEQGNVLGITLEPTTKGTKPQHYGLFAPAGASWSGTDSDTLTSDLAGAGYLTVAVLPDDTASTLTEFERYAYNVVRDTTVDWTYSQSDGEGNPVSSVETTYSFDLEQQAESAAAGTLTTLLPNQWKNLADGQPTMAYTYWSNRGTLKAFQGSSFTTELTYPGILPGLPTTDSVDESRLGSYIDTLRNDTAPYYHSQIGDGQGANEAYWIAKPLKRNDSLIPLADELGKTGIRDFYIDANRERLTGWFDANDNTIDVDGGPTFDLTQESEVTYYHTDIGSLITYPGGEFGAVPALNDHHLQFGYFIYVASTIARYDPQWADDYGDMIELMVRDYANWDRPGNNGQDGEPTPVTPTTPAESPGDAFPFLRTFSPYVGHSHAGGIQGNVWGANQESCSESIGAYAAMIRWGEVRLQQASTESQRQRARKIRDTGVFLYTHEINAFWEYWFDADGDSQPDGWGSDIGPGELQDRPAGTNEEFSFAANTWDNGYWRSIYWQPGNPIETFGINWIPMGGQSLYLGRDRVYSQKVWDQYQLAREIRGLDGYPDGWQQAAWGFRAMTNPDDAVSEMEDGLPIAAAGDSTPHIYQFVTAMSDLGLTEQDVTADTPFYRVFEDGDQRTYVVDNPADEAITVNFSDGHTMTAGPGLSYESSSANYEAPPTPSAPQNVTATNVTSHTVDLTWDEPAGDETVLGYEVYFDDRKMDTVGETSASLSIEREKDGGSVPTVPVDRTGWSTLSNSPAPAIANGELWKSNTAINSADMAIEIDLGGTQPANSVTIQHDGTDFPTALDVEVLTDSGWETVASGAGGQALVEVSFSERSISKVRIDETDDQTAPNWWSISSVDVANSSGPLAKDGWSATFFQYGVADGVLGSGSWSSGAMIDSDDFSVTVDVGEQTTLSEVTIAQSGSDFPATFDLELYDGSSWTTVASGHEGAQTVTVSFEPQTVSRFRVAETDDQTDSNWWTITDITAAAPDPTADGPVSTLDHTVGVVALGSVNDASPRANVDITLDGSDTEPPTRPTGLNVGRGSTTATLQWNESTDVGWEGLDHYNVYAGTYPDGESIQVPTNDTTQTITGLSPDTSYEFALTAVDAAGNESAPATQTVRMRPEGVEQTPYGDGPAQVPGVIEAAALDEGGEGVAYHDTTNWDQGPDSFRDGETVDVDTTPSGGTAVGWTDAGEWLEYTIDVAAAGTYDLELLYVSGTPGGGGGQFSLEIDDEPIGSTVELAQTTSWTDFTTHTVSGLKLDGGVQTLRFLIEEGGITVASVQFVRTDADDDNEPPTPEPTLGGVYHDSVDVSWDPVTDAESGVDHYRFDWDGGSQEVSALKSSATVSGFSAGTSYDVTMVAVDAAGNESTPSDPFSFTTFSGDQYPFRRRRTAPTRIQAEDFDADPDYSGGETSDAFRNQFIANGWGTAGLGTALGNYRSEQVFLFANSDGGYRVGALAGTTIEDGPDVEGSWWEYTVRVPATGTYELYVAVANSETSDAAFSASIDGATLASDVSVPVTGGDESWQTVRVGEYTFESTGDHVVRIDTEVGGWSFDWLDLREPLALSPPQSPAVESTTDTTVDLSWATPAAGEPDEYQVTVSGDTDRTLTVSSTETTVEGLSPNTTYEFQIRAVVDGFSSAPTSPVSTKTTIDVEYTHSITQPSNTAVDVHFTPEAAVAAVRLQYAVGDGDQQTVDMTSDDGTWTARVSGLTDGATVSYAFVYDRAGASRRTDTATHDFSADTTAPSSPGDLAVADRTIESITLAWAAPGDADLDHYVVREGDRVVATTTATQATVRELSPGTDYELAVTAVDRVGNESTAVARTAATVAITDDMAAGAIDNWLTGAILADDDVPTDDGGRVDYGTVRELASTDGGEDE